MSDLFAICAVVVTHNRLKLLQRCVSSLFEQSYPLSSIVIIDNDSTDGTREWLDQLAQRQGRLIVIHQENLWGAGGFNRGLKEAYQRGFSWFWLMDDDCFPDIRACELLVAALRRHQNNEHICFGSIALDPDTRRFTFPMKERIGYSNKTMGKSWYALEELPEESKVSCLLYGNVTAFVGLLVSRATVAELGYPISGFKIHGDEIEYLLRMKQRHIMLCTVLDSVVFHKTPVAGNSHKDYYEIRNRTIIYARYWGAWALLWWSLHLVKDSFKKMLFQGIFPWNIFRAYFAGLMALSMGSLKPEPPPKLDTSSLLI